MNRVDKVIHRPCVLWISCEIRELPAQAKMSKGVANVLFCGNK